MRNDTLSTAEVQRRRKKSWREEKFEIKHKQIINHSRESVKIFTNEQSFLLFDAPPFPPNTYHHVPCVSSLEADVDVEGE